MRASFRICSLYWDHALSINLDEIVYIHCHRQGWSSLLLNFCRAMLCKRDLCRHVVSVCLSVCLSVCHGCEICQNEQSYPQTFFYHRVAKTFQFFRHGSIPT